MSAHARLAAIAAAQAAMADLLRRIGCPDAATDGKWYYSGRYVVRATVPICDEPVNRATEVVADLEAQCFPGGKAQVSARSIHWSDVGDGSRAGWPDNFRFLTRAGVGLMAPRTLAPMIVAAMKPAD